MKSQEFFQVAVGMGLRFPTAAGNLRESGKTGEATMAFKAWKDLGSWSGADPYFEG